LPRKKKAPSEPKPKIRKDRVIELPPSERRVHENINHSAVFAELSLSSQLADDEELKLKARRFAAKKKKHTGNSETPDAPSGSGSPQSELLDKDKIFPSQLLFGEKRNLPIPVQVA
jgi:hypothetical protein